MADSNTKPSPNRRGLGTAGAPPKSNTANQQNSGLTGRSAYQQRLDEMKVRIVDLSHRNMENALRILRTWMSDA